jgi:hypothetical protein
MHDCVVRLRRRFLWSPPATEAVSLEEALLLLTAAVDIR